MSILIHIKIKKFEAQNVYIRGFSQVYFLLIFCNILKEPRFSGLIDNAFVIIYNSVCGVFSF